MRILHWDIKPANIFITATRHIINGDYGLARAFARPGLRQLPIYLAESPQQSRQNWPGIPPDQARGGSQKGWAVGMAVEG